MGPIIIGLPALVLPVLAAVLAPSPRTLGLIAAGYLFDALCMLCVLWTNTRVDFSALADTVNGWFFGAAFLTAWVTAFSTVGVLRYLKVKRYVHP